MYYVLLKVSIHHDDHETVCLGVYSSADSAKEWTAKMRDRNIVWEERGTLTESAWTSVDFNGTFSERYHYEIEPHRLDNE